MLFIYTPQLEHLMKHQARRPRPNANVLRNTDVTKELVASRDVQQINTAVDSILSHEEAHEGEGQILSIDAFKNKLYMYVVDACIS